jgi:hypothetical protein
MELLIKERKCVFERFVEAHHERSSFNWHMVAQYLDQLSVKAEDE